MKFKLTSQVTVTYEHEIDCDTLSEAIDWVLDQQDDGVETDSSAPVVVFAGEV